MTKLEPYSGYKVTGIEWLEQIPAEWEISKFRYCFLESSEVNGSNIVGEMLSVSGYRGVEPKVYEDENQKRAAEQLETYRVVRKGQLAVNTMWLNYAGLGISDHEGHVSPAYRTYWVTSKLYPRYAHHLMRSSKYVDAYTARLTGVRPNSLQMSRANLMEFPVIVPPRPVQERIAAFLDLETAQIDDLIDKQERLIELLAEKRQAIITHAVTRGLDPAVPTKSSGFPWLGDIPGHWTVPQLGMHAKIGNGSTPNRDTAEYWSEGNIPWLNSSHVNRDEISDADQFVTEIATTECHLPVVGAESLLIGLTGQGRTRGMTSILRFPATINQHVACVTPETSVWNPWYLLWFLRSSYTRLRELSDENGSTKGALTCTAIKKLNIALPPLSEQSAIAANIADRLAGLNRVVAACTATIEVLRERRAALISAAVTGQLNIQP